MRKIVLFMFLSIATLLTANAQVKWLSFEEAVKLNKEKPKAILIDVYTTWCGYCKVMDKKTFNDPEIAKMINENFYPVKFNAESTDPITFEGHTYTYDKKNRVHQLAIAILQGQMSYPSIAYMNGENQLLSVVPGFQEPANLKPMLKYFGEGHYKTIAWNDYMANYKKS